MPRLLLIRIPEQNAMVRIYRGAPLVPRFVFYVAHHGPRQGQQGIGIYFPTLCYAY
jgi:hypothetical protein